MFHLRLSGIVLHYANLVLILNEIGSLGFGTGRQKNRIVIREVIHRFGSAKTILKNPPATLHSPMQPIPGQAELPPLLAVMHGK